MSAYWINAIVEISDEEKLSRYAALAGPAMLAGGGRFLARGNPAQTFEEAGGVADDAHRVPLRRGGGGDVSRGGGSGGAAGA